MRKSIMKGILLVFSGLILSSCSNEPLDLLNPVDHVAKTSVNYTYSQLEEDILSRINAHRKEKGLLELALVSEISVLAEGHNFYMLDKGKVSHDNFGERYTALVEGIGAKSVSENVAFGYRTAEAVVKAWVGSDGHRKNLEADHTHFGLSVVEDQEGRNYFTNIFVRK